MEKLNQNTKNQETKEKKVLEMKLSEEEEELKKNIEEMVRAFLEPDLDIKRNAYNMLKKEIISATETMTSIPKPLKFVRIHYPQIKEAYEAEKTANPNSEAQKLYGDILCILVLVTDTEETSLVYILENNLTTFSEWGNELVRSVSGEITTEYLKRLDEDKTFDDLFKLVSATVKVLIDSHNENEAIDLLVELELIDDIKNFCSETNYKKFCTYLLSISNYSADNTEQRKILEIVYEIYTKYNEYTNALRTAIKLKESMYIKSTITGCPNKLTKYQMAFILARSGIFFESSDLEPEVIDIMRNLKTSEYFKELGRTLDVVEPKHPEQIYKSHLEEKKEGVQLESLKVNMSTSLVSSFINAGFGTECLLSKKDDKDNDWLSKNKDEGLLCALAGLGLVNLWDIECGPNEVEKYMDVNEMNPFKRGGYNLALGILSSNVKDENSTAFALLSEQTQDKK